AGELRQPQDLPIRDVRDVRLAEERQQVVLAERVEVDVPHQHHLVVVVLGEDRAVQDLVDVLLVARGEELQHGFHARRRLLESFPLRILAELAQDALDQLLHAAPPAASYSKRLFSVSTTATRLSLPGGSARSRIP